MNRNSLSAGVIAIAPLIADETEKWTKVIRAASIKTE
jgi:hypothetical protein